MYKVQRGNRTGLFLQLWVLTEINITDVIIASTFIILTVRIASFHHLYSAMCCFVQAGSVIQHCAILLISTVLCCAGLVGDQYCAVLCRLGQ